MYENMIASLKTNLMSGGILGNIEYDCQLSATAYIILAVVLLGIIAGLGWCLYRAVMATDKSIEPQRHDEVGDQ